MKPSHRLPFIAALLAAIVAGSAPVAAADLGAEVSTDGDTCCFTNPRFSGVCEVTPGPNETCADVLAYLNNQTSVGKTYCGNTKVRGGWAQVDCDSSASACTPAEAAPVGPSE